MTQNTVTGLAQRIWDPALGAACLVVALVLHLDGSQAVSRNLDPGVFSVLLTVVAVGPLVVRRRYPLSVLGLTLLGLLALVATRNTVGVATIGCTVAFYTAVAAARSRRELWVAVSVMVTAVAIGLLMQPVDLTSSGAFSTLVFFTAAGVLGSGVRERRERHDAEMVATRERAARSASDERLRITRELHDIVGHAMGIMVVQAGVAEQLLDSDPARARTAVAQIGTTGRSSLGEMRQVLGVLRETDERAGPLPRSPLPGLADLPSLVAEMHSAGLPVTMDLEDLLEDVPSGIGLAAYRIVQGSLTNCLKHADATTVSVRVSHADGDLRVQVLDNGVARPAAAPDGQGLRGMRERVAVYGGQLAAGPVDAGGFRVDASFPIRGAT